MAQIDLPHHPVPHTAPEVPKSQSEPQQETLQPTEPESSLLQLPTILTYPPAADSPPSKLITQGAEALLFRSTYLIPSILCALKYRPPKPYRHPILDARLTKHRILSEARVLVKCRREGVPVPAVYALDEAQGWIMMEWIEGEVVRVKLNEWLARRKRSDLVGRVGGRSENENCDDKLRNMMNRVGRALGCLHACGVVHGDLTTSNLMLRPYPDTISNAHEREEPESADMDQLLDGEIVLIDFGLASQTTQDEDRAVDLYVLERAFGSTHPRAESLFSELLKAYGQSFKGAIIVLKRLEEVRMRGRKRSMLG